MKTAHDAVERVLATLDRLEIPYLIGGSVASSVFGMSRPTMDVDFVVDLRPEQVDEFVDALQSDFYADAETIRKALRLGRAFNLIHYLSSFKVDMFPLKQDAYSQASFARRRFEHSRSFGSEPVECAVATAEDTLLRKLEWYRAGGENSERQWNDLRGIRDVSGRILDYEYLRHWAKVLKVDDLLEKLLAE